MVRKRCKHAKGLRGNAARKAWRKCGCVWGVDLLIDGRRTWHNLGSDEAAAHVRELRLRADLREGRRGARTAGVGFRDQAQDWLAQREADGARVQSLSTWRSRVAHLNDYFGNEPISEIKGDHVRRMAQKLRAKNLAPATVNGVIAALGSVIRHARANGIRIEPLDLSGVRYTVHERSDHLTIQECGAVIEAASEPWAAAFELALLTGLRKGELLALTARDVERDRPILHVRGTLTHKGTVNDPKTAKSRRAVTLSPRAHEIALERAGSAGDGRLWPHGPHEADKALRDVLRKLGLHRPGRGWHGFRHAHTTLLNESGIALRDAAARLGHGANTAQTLAYGWAAEQVDAAIIDAAVKRHAPEP